MRGRDPGSDRVRVVPELRRLVEFRRLNFMDADYGMHEKFDAIFCRNVIIYFDRPTQQQHPRASLRNACARRVSYSWDTPRRCTIWISRSTPVAPSLYRRGDARA